MQIHIRANADQISPYVIIPGDPDRSEYIAKTYLENVSQYTKYRHLYGYTGTYKGTRVSVQTTGMGVPSCLIVCEELIMLKAKYLVRIGTCGGLQKKMKLGESILATAAWGSRETVSKIVDSADYCPTPDTNTLFSLYNSLKDKNKVYLGPITTGELFYNNIEKNLSPQAKLGCLGVEMESAGLFALGSKHKINTACILTISDLVQADNIERADESVILDGVKENTISVLEMFHLINKNQKC